MIQSSQITGQNLERIETAALSSIVSTLVFLLLAALGSVLLVVAELTAVSGMLVLAAVGTSLIAAVKSSDVNLEV